MESEDWTVEVAQKGSSKRMEAIDKQRQLKVEMTNLVISEEARTKLLETIKFIQGEDFEAKKISDYKDSKVNLANQYWVDRGHLVIQGATDYSMIKKKALLPHERLNVFALNRLQNYGFHKNHCAEALQVTKGDFGKAFEFLMSHYMGVNLPVEDTDVPEDVLQERNEELESVKEIFGQMLEERISNQLWIVHLDLPYILENYNNRTKSELEATIKIHKPSKAPSNKKEMCRNFVKGHCSYGSNCRFSHEPPVNKVVVKCAAEDARKETATKFDLEIRFPKGCCYPRDPPLVAFSPQSDDMPSTPRLKLTYYLQTFCKEQAESQFPCVYSLIDKFELHNKDEILDVINARGPAPCILDPAVPLCPEVVSSCLEEIESDEELEVYRPATLSKDKIKEKLEQDDSELAKRFEQKEASPRYKTMLQQRRKLPAFSKMEAILLSLSKSQVVVVSGATGCGKSTQVPQYILDDWLRKRARGDTSHVEVICTQPRRLSAIGVAERVAYERLESVGASIGYSIRLESKVSKKTRLTFCTTGILLRRLEADPQLTSVSHIIVDEVHERSEESDFLLLILKKLLPQRPDIRVILMSATLNAELFCKYFNDVPVVDIPGRTFPVEQLFLEDIVEATGYVIEESSKYCRKLNKTSMNQLETLETELELADVMSGRVISNAKTADHDLTVKQLCHRYKDYSRHTWKSIYLMDHERINYELIETVLLYLVDGDHQFPKEGSILVFLPGMQEIREMHDMLSNNQTFNPRNNRFKLVPLHSSLSSEEQAQVFEKPKNGVRKIVLSTNIAETSVTIDDCVFVIDSGKMKETRFDSNKNMASLETVWVSRANALQRKGRAGRVMPGICVHLYTLHRYDYLLDAQPIPEIKRVPLEQTILRIKMLPSMSGAGLQQVLGEVLEPPTEESITGAITRLVHVGALDRAENLTPLGQHLAALPVDVRIGKLLLYGAMFSCLDSVLTIAASLSQKSPFQFHFDKKDEVNKKKKEFMVANSDHFTILRAYNGWRKAAASGKNAGYTYANENFLSVRTMQTLIGIKSQFLEYLASIGFVPDNCRGQNRRCNEDKILELTGEELNSNGENYKLLAGLLSAALYPNIVKVLSPEKFYAHSISGAVPKEQKPEDLKFKTKCDGYVHLHPSSVNYNQGRFSSPYLVFQEKVKTSKIFIRDCTMVPVLPLVMFSSNELSVELSNSMFTISLEDRWIMFTINNHAIGELLQTMQKELLKLMDQKIKDPSLNLLTDPRGKKILSTITYLVTHG
ncbi:putative ATP-dependent RNA helicase DHX57 [Macrosteles quadrilineatus]|uniref:putative ATP-dependent RNA helicase DHX57 n=1 Tax=Macrosteles quadrilineatus TaxID=74068 RepID=UPI0023E19AD6|nr:putative ATP-dependent RNA helicase DHX57 [Macrosteles quadrilineatus]